MTDKVILCCVLLCNYDQCLIQEQNRNMEYKLLTCKAGHGIKMNAATMNRRFT
jgi:hypothetical protein